MTDTSATRAAQGPADRSPSTWIEALLSQASRRRSRPAFTVVGLDGGRRTLSYAELLEQSLCVAAGLRERGLRQGDRLLICLPTSPELLTTFFGTLLAGGVCVPLYPPQARQGLRHWREQVRVMGRLAQPRGAVLRGATRLPMASVLEQLGDDLFTATPAQLIGRGGAHPAAVGPEDLAFVQFTSGTTRRPRGVAVSHRALMANLQALLQVMPLGEGDLSVSWLPPYHDMGLVGHLLMPVLAGVHQLLMPQAVMLRRPERWLELCTSSGATQTTAPNFAFALCLRRIGRAERRRLDLSQLRWVLNGSEMVLPETLADFCRTFEASGFRREAFRPVYGLAETTLAATFSREPGARVDWVDRAELAGQGRARPLAARGGQAGTLGLVSVGAVLPGHQLEVREERGLCAPRQVGEVCLRGPSVMSGYFNDPVATREVLRNGWLHTGDLGYLDEEGRLHLTGRRKDLIIKNGRNLLPDDVESALHGMAGLRPGRAVAFGLPCRRTGTEELVVVAEVRAPTRSGDPILRERVARAVASRTGMRPDRVELAEAGRLPKTTSGKLQRGKVKTLYQRGLPLSSPLPAPVDLLLQSVRSAMELASAKIARILNWQ